MFENTREDLFTLGHQKTYKGKYLNEISFPLGGIGTGSIGLTGNGSLRDLGVGILKHMELYELKNKIGIQYVEF